MSSPTPSHAAGPYFSEREQGDRARDIDTLSTTAWGGVQALIGRCVTDGSFGATFAERCPDGGGLIGTDETALWRAMNAEIPSLQRQPWYSTSDVPSTLDALDIAEFCYRSVGKPIQGRYHEFFRHHHLTFDLDTGKKEFRETVNRIFRRNGLAYELSGYGRVERLAPPVLREALASALFRTPDSELNRMLETARRKFLDPDEAQRREALESLWDAWERLKTVWPGAHKQAQISAMLDAAAGPSPKFREALEKDARELTMLGNSLQIRHSETSQERIAGSRELDYLLHRLFALIQLILRSSAGA